MPPILLQHSPSASVELPIRAIRACRLHRQKRHTGRSSGAATAAPKQRKREGSGGEARRDMSAEIRAGYEASRLSEAQVAALRWLASQPGGPAKILVISEEWSSDCRRDVPMLARMAEAASLDLRIFTRDGQRFSQSQQPSLDEAPDSNADLMAKFMNVKNGQAWQSIPVAAFYTRDFEYLYHYTEYPAIYHKDRLVNEY